MSVPCGSAAPFPVLDRRIRDELTAHREKVFAALSRHSDPALREIGRLLAAGAASPQQLREDPLRADQLRRIARKLKEMDPQTRGPGTNPSGSPTQPDGPNRPPHGSGAQLTPVGTPFMGPGAPPVPAGAPVTGRDTQPTRAGARSEGASSSHDRDEAGHAHQAGPAREPTTPTRTIVREVCPPSGGEPTRPAG
ncbi:hypothetical protein GCM10009557_30810 [Virgisporangium ochraceum]|uniref:Uncharacterized protein n=1 Tax=Virgisporangium ochraceum TaxID=65505 RepID=A0A8J4A6A6_9ACTN|nr:hypothetical protein Voc01_095720 [Virgisporangium ochraceum]